MSRSDQRSAHAAPEKVAVQESRHITTPAGGAIRGRRCGAVAGKSLHAPMT